MQTPTPPPPPTLAPAKQKPRATNSAPPLSSELAARFTKKSPANYREKEYELVGQKIKLLEDEDGGVGGSVWISCLALFAHLEKKYGAEFLRDKRILELGSGTGLVGLGLACLGARNVTMTDLESVVPLIEKNVSVNPATAPYVKVAELSWGEEKSFAKFEGYQPDIIIASECLYSSILYPILVETITHFAGKDTLVFVSYEPRIDREHQFFETMAPNFDVKEQIHTEIEGHKACISCLQKKA